MLKTKLFYFPFLVLWACNSGSGGDGSDDTFITFAKEIETSIGNLDPGVMNACWNVDEFADRVVEDNGDFIMNLSIKEGIKNGVTNFGNTIVQTLEYTEGLYNFTRFYRDENQKPHVIFRLYGLDGINYHDFELEMKDNEVRANDCYIYLTGENLSSTLALMLKGTLEGQSDAENEKFMGEMNKANQIRQLLMQGYGEAADDIYQSLDTEISKFKLFQLIGLNLALANGDEEYKNALENYNMHFPNDPSLDLVRIDHLYMKRNWDELWSTIDRLEERVGKDPVLNLYRCNVRLEEDKFSEGLEYINKLTDTYPEVLDFQYVKLVSQILNVEYPEAIEQMKTMQNNFDLTVSDFHFEEFKEFENSTVYQQWYSEQ